MFVYEGHRVKVKVTKLTGAQKARKSLLPQCYTSISNNAGSVEDRAVKFTCSMGFSAIADRMVSSPSSSCDRK